MAKRPTLTDITSLTNSSAINALSENWDAIEEAFDNTLSLDGSTPNALNADLDLNGNALLNVGTIDVENLTLDGQTITDITAVPEWRGAWLTATSYVKRDMVKTAGNVYICLEAHTSGTFATDLTAVKWELMVSKGDSGAGTGDMLGANNLSDLADDATARANLGLGTVATENTVPIGKGGTGATDASTARTNLGLGVLATAASITASEIAAATLVTAADTITTNDNDTTIPTSAAVKAYVDSVSSGEGWTVIETLTMTGTQVETVVAWTAGKKYRFTLRGISHSNGSNTFINVAFYGDTAGTYTTARQIVDGWSNSNYMYGEFYLEYPMNAKNLHFFRGHSVATSSSSGSTFSGDLADGGKQGAYAHYSTAQTVSKIRFSILTGFDAGTIIVEESD